MITILLFKGEWNVHDDLISVIDSCEDAKLTIKSNGVGVKI